MISILNIIGFVYLMGLLLGSCVILICVLNILVPVSRGETEDSKKIILYILMWPVFLVILFPKLLVGLIKTPKFAYEQLKLAINKLYSRNRD